MFLKVFFLPNHCFPVSLTHNLVKHDQTMENNLCPLHLATEAASTDNVCIKQSVAKQLVCVCYSSFLNKSHPFSPEVESFCPGRH